ncbi:hydroxymethylglutaryl-CoA synthase family protein [Sphingomonas sp.]|uniref:hydroxymethylglutaryl-CoA synthase family protein n=1 Tax=Sphingomonas sp. TaxID=28214 RepID=UPI003D6D7F78
MTGIIAYGGYVPRMRLQRAAIHAANSWFAPGLKGLAKGERAIANWDEDPITMAVEAARDCLGGVDRAGLASVMLASTSLPFADRQNAGVVKEALNLSDMVATLDVTGSQRAGTSSLLSALQAVAGGSGPVLHLAAEKRQALPASEAEMVQGDAASALLVGTGNPIARFVGHHSVATDFVDHFRASGQDFDYGWETRWVRDEGIGKILGGAIRDALAKFGLEGRAIDRLIVPITTRGVAEGLAKAAGIAPAAIVDTLAATVGESGTAHATLMLAHALESAKPGERILVTSFGQGADILLFEVTDAIAGAKPLFGVSGWLARRREESNYLKYLSLRGLLALDRGMRAEQDHKVALTALYRNRKAVLGLVGGRCSKTGTVQFPKTDISVNPNDHAIRTQEDYPLAERPARILTYTADSLTYSPDPPSCYGSIEFEGGGRMMAEFADIEPDAIEVGAALRMMFRIKAVDEKRDFKRYFWKAAPAS